MPDSPSFGNADLTNCERELIHLAGSIQPHGLLFSIAEPELRIVQVSVNCGALLGIAAQALLNQPIAVLGEDVALQLGKLAALPDLSEPLALGYQLQIDGQPREFEGAVHRVRGSLLLLELEPVGAVHPGAETVEADGTLRDQLDSMLSLCSAASTVDRLADAAVRGYRALTGYDRVMVYKFDPDGHGKVIAEARHPRLEPLLGHHYPASDIPQRARELYLRNRLRVLVDVHYQAAPLEPRRPPGQSDELDMSLCYLRSMSPLHLQYLKNMGVTATLVVRWSARDGSGAWSRAITTVRATCALPCAPPRICWQR